jgi:hypothetical protein
MIAWMLYSGYATSSPVKINLPPCTAILGELVNDRLRRYAFDISNLSSSTVGPKIFTERGSD